jgi:hypothetical protein
MNENQTPELKIGVSPFLPVGTVVKLSPALRKELKKDIEFGKVTEIGSILQLCSNCVLHYMNPEFQCSEIFPCTSDQRKDGLEVNLTPMEKPE